jgi:hypothetical protein
MSSTDEDEDDGEMAHHFSGEGCFRKQNDLGRVEILEEPSRHAAAAAAAGKSEAATSIH